MKDRNAWRISIEEKKFDPQVESLVWGGKHETRVYQKNDMCDAEDEDIRSEISSSVEGENNLTLTAKKNVSDLACALLQLAQSVEMKYLKKPLGINL